MSFISEMNTQHEIDVMEARIAERAGTVDALNARIGARATVEKAEQPQPVAHTIRFRTLRPSSPRLSSCGAFPTPPQRRPTPHASAHVCRS